MRSLVSAADGQVAVVHVRLGIVVFGTSQNDSQSSVPVFAGAAGADVFSTDTGAALALVPNVGRVTFLARFGLRRSTVMWLVGAGLDAVIGAAWCWKESCWANLNTATD